MLSALFWNVIAPIAIVGVPLFWLDSWIWVFAKVDGFVHRQFLDPKPYVPTPEEQAASQVRAMEFVAQMQRNRAAIANHHH